MVEGCLSDEIVAGEVSHLPPDNSSVIAAKNPPLENQSFLVLAYYL